MTRSGGPFVRTEDFLAVIRPVVVERERLRAEWKASTSIRAEGRVEVVGAAQFIAFQIGKHPRTVSRVLNGESEYTSLRVVDEWLIALGLVHKMHELEIVEDP